jgi:hypothetical protein
MHDEASGSSADEQSGDNFTFMQNLDRCSYRLFQWPSELRVLLSARFVDAILCFAVMFPDQSDKINSVTFRSPVKQVAAYDTVRFQQF